MSPRASLGKQADGNDLVHFRCPGCVDFHQVRVGTWTFNGDLDLPTFTPSVLVRGKQLQQGDGFFNPAHNRVLPGGEIVCHSFVTDGRIQFLGDCTHALAGQTVDLPEWKP